MKKAAEKNRHPPVRDERVAPRRLRGGAVWQPLLVVIAAALAYSDSFHGEFLFDDNQAIVSNGRLRTLWPLTHFFADSRPVTDFTFALNLAVHDVDPWGFHAVNVAIHILSALMLYGLVRRTLLLKRFVGRFDESAAGLAFACALLWVLHPLATQAVTYIVQRAESLMALFYLLTLYCLCRCATAKRPLVWGGLAIAACALGMGSKAVMVTAPLVALLYDLVFITRLPRETLRHRWPLYAGFLATIWILWQVGVIGGLYLKEQGEPISVGFAMENMTAKQYALTQPGVILHYLRLCFWPHPLVIDYGWPLAKTAGEIVPGVLVIGALLVGSLWALWKRPALGFVGVAFFVILAPTSSIVPIRDAAFEHRMYLPLAAVVVIVVVASHFFIGRLAKKDSSSGPMRAGLILIAALGLGLTTFVHNGLYADSVRLWQKNIARTPQNPRPINALGFALYKQGRYQEAVERFNEAIRLDPFYAGAYANKSLVYCAQRNFAEAVKCGRMALDISPNELRADFHYYYGSALLEVGRVDEAIASLEEVTRTAPDFRDGQYNLGNAYLAKGRHEDAVRIYRQVVARFPNYPEAYVNLGLALGVLGRQPEAVEAYRQGLKVGGNMTRRDVLFKAHYNAGMALQTLGRIAEAREEITAALGIYPDHPGAVSALRSLPGH